MKEIRIVDESKGIVQITTEDERFYARPEPNETTGLPVYKYYPSSTWISGYFPKGIPFYKWLAEHGWDEAQAIKQAAGDKGSKVHNACELLETEGRFAVNSQQFLNPTTQQPELLHTDELECVFSFCEWWKKIKPELLTSERTVFGEFYAGTLDRIYRIDGQIWIVDLKTGQSIWEEYKLQVSSYSHATIDYKLLGITDAEWTARKLAILQLGYRLNKNRYKFTEIEDKFDLFKVVYQIWLNENPDAKPKQRDYPLVLEIKPKLEVSNGGT